MNKTNPCVPCEEAGWWDAFGGRELIRATSLSVASFHQQRAVTWGRSCGGERGGPELPALCYERGGVLNLCSKSNSSWQIFCSLTIQWTWKQPDQKPWKTGRELYHLWNPKTNQKQVMTTLQHRFSNSPFWFYQSTQHGEKGGMNSLRLSTVSLVRIPGWH